MNFRTEIKIPESEIGIDHQDTIFSIGSCFSANVGQILEEHKFDICSNPFGVVYNPISLVKQCSRLIYNEKIDDDSVVQIGERWVHYDYHSDLRTTQKTDWSSLYVERALNAQSKLVNASVLIITLGTSIVHRLSNDQVVANCHKQNKSHFTKEMLSIDDSYEALFALIKELPQSIKKVIVTVSPIRHTREGIINNQRSKARLVEVANLLASSFEQVDYFPAYEIMMDDLRDYRFYTKDLIHPSNLAVQYIWNRFKETYFSEETIRLNEEIQKICQASKHVPFDSESKAFTSFCENQSQSLIQLSKTHPSLDFSKELFHFRAYTNTA